MTIWGLWIMSLDSGVTLFLRRGDGALHFCRATEMALKGFARAALSKRTSRAGAIEVDELEKRDTLVVAISGTLKRVILFRVCK